MITARDVLDMFAGAKIVEEKPSRCVSCSSNATPEWRRGGKIIERVWPDGDRDRACAFCGRAEAK